MGLGLAYEIHQYACWNALCTPLSSMLVEHYHPCCSYSHSHSSLNSCFTCQCVPNLTKILYLCCRIDPNFCLSPIFLVHTGMKNMSSPKLISLYFLFASFPVTLCLVCLDQFSVLLGSTPLPIKSPLLPQILLLVPDYLHWASPGAPLFYALFCNFCHYSEKQQRAQHWSVDTNIYLKFFRDTFHCLHSRFSVMVEQHH